MGIPFIGINQINPTRSVKQFLAEQEAKINLPGGLSAGGLLTTLLRTDGVPNTRTRLDHAFTLRANSGRIIGAVYNIDQRQARQIDDEYEIDVNAHGEVADMVGQHLTGRTLAVQRYDLYTDVMEEVFGSSELVMLTDQSRGFRLREAWRAPGGIFTGGQRLYEYSPVWFSDIGRALNAEGDRVVRVNATLTWGIRQRVL